MPLAEPCSFHVAWVYLTGHTDEHLAAWGTGRGSIRGRLGCAHDVVDNVHYLSRGVAHDHGYCYLQTKDVSGAAFDGASDGGVVSSTRTDQNVIQGWIR